MFKFIQSPKFNKLFTPLLIIAVLVAIYSHFMLWGHPYMTDDEGLNFRLGTISKFQLDSGFAWFVFIQLLRILLPPWGFKLAFVSLGIISSFCTYFILKMFASRNLSLLGMLMLLMQSVFVTQTHRIRPETLHVFCAVLSMLCILYSAKRNPKYKANTLLMTLKSFLKDWSLIVGIILIALIPNTHIVGVTVLPGIVIVLAYVLIKKVQTPKYFFSLLTLIAILIILPFLITQPHILDLDHWLGIKNELSKSSNWGSQDTLFSSIRKALWIYLNYSQDNVQPLFHSSNILLRPLSYAKHRVLEFALLNMAFFITSFYAIYHKCKNKKIDLSLLLIVACVINVLCYILHVLIAQRMITYYLITPIPWLVIGLTLSISYVINHKLYNKYAQTAMTLIITSILFLGYWNMYVYIWQVRDNNFKVSYDKIMEETIARQCDDFPIVSEPYWVFFSEQNPLIHSRLVGWFHSMNAENYSKNLRGICDRIIHNPNSCILVSAWHYYGLYHFSNFSSSDKIRGIYEKYFDISTIDFPFYKNDPFYPRPCNDEPECKSLNYPIGFPGLWVGGKETIHIMKPKDQYLEEIEKELCQKQ